MKMVSLLLWGGPAGYAAPGKRETLKGVALADSRRESLSGRVRRRGHGPETAADTFGLLPEQP